MMQNKLPANWAVIVLFYAKMAEFSYLQSQMDSNLDNILKKLVRNHE